MTALPVTVRFGHLNACAVCGYGVCIFVSFGNGYVGTCVMIGWFRWVSG